MKKIFLCIFLVYVFYLPFSFVNNLAEEKQRNISFVKCEENRKKNEIERNKNCIKKCIKNGKESCCDDYNIFDFPNFCDIIYLENPPVLKPVIYLYPTKTQEVSTKLYYDGDLFVTYPEYGTGWNVIAQPNGDLVDIRDSKRKEYSYLFWEGTAKEKVNYDLSKGFVVEGKDTAKFLQSKLKEIGLTPKEYNEFIVYWLPQMLHNKYNLIHFASKQEYDEKAILDITPKEDSMLRVFMVFKKLDEKVEGIKPQEFKIFERKGFSVVEWGGSEIGE